MAPNKLSKKACPASRKLLIFSSIISITLFMSVLFNAQEIKKVSISILEYDNNLIATRRDERWGGGDIKNNYTSNFDQPDLRLSKSTYEHTQGSDIDNRISELEKNIKHLLNSTPPSAEKNDSDSSPMYKRPTYFKHDALPPQPIDNIKPTEVFSACMLIKDDNTILSEWLAYHYVALPLRNLVVAVDPHSKTSPEKILRRWGNGSNFDHAGASDKSYTKMNIELWGDTDIYPDRTPEQIKELQNIRGLGADEIVRRHIDRQMQMMSQCMKYHKKAGRTWVILADSDEYLVFNPNDKNDRPPMKKNWKDPNTVSTPDKVATENWWHRKFEYQKNTRSRVPRIGGNVSIADFVLAEKNQHPWLYEDDPCLNVPRLFYSSKKSNPSVVQSAVPDRIKEKYNTDTLNTIRYRHNAGKFHNKFNLLGKSIVDVARVSFENLAHVSDNTHSPIKGVCKRAYTKYDISILRFNHYLGPWEEHAKREDVRRSKEHYDWKANISEAEDDVIREWLRLFYVKFGLIRAAELLQLSSLSIN